MSDSRKPGEGHAFMPPPPPDSMGCVICGLEWRADVHWRPAGEAVAEPSRELNQDASPHLYRIEIKALRDRVQALEQEIAEKDRLMAHESVKAGQMAARVGAAEARVAALEKERDEARRFGEDAANRYNALLADTRILRCAFCDAKYLPDTPPTQHEALTAHVAVCPRHPMRKAEKEASDLREALKEVLGVVYWMSGAEDFAGKAKVGWQRAQREELARAEALLSAGEHEDK